MRYTTQIFEQIVDNRQLRLKIALALNMSECGVMSSAKRKSTSLTKYPAVETITSVTGLTLSEIFEPETATCHG